jgi:hypothetical protein
MLNPIPWNKNIWRIRGVAPRSVRVFSFTSRPLYSRDRSPSTDRVGGWWELVLVWTIWRRKKSVTPLGNRIPFIRLTIPWPSFYIDLSASILLQPFSIWPVFENILGKIIPALWIVIYVLWLVLQEFIYFCNTQTSDSLRYGKLQRTHFFKMRAPHLI